VVNRYLSAYHEPDPGTKDVPGTKDMNKRDTCPAFKEAVG